MSSKDYAGIDSELYSRESKSESVFGSYKWMIPWGETRILSESDQSRQRFVGHEWRNAQEQKYADNNTCSARTCLYIRAVETTANYRPYNSVKSNAAVHSNKNTVVGLRARWAYFLRPFTGHQYVHHTMMPIEYAPDIGVKFWWQHPALTNENTEGIVHVNAVDMGHRLLTRFLTITEIFMISHLIVCRLIQSDASVIQLSTVSTRNRSSALRASSMHFM